MVKLFTPIKDLRALWRGYGVTQCNFAVESIVNELAQVIDKDPIELRLLNMIKPGDLKDIFGIDGNEVITSSEMEKCLKQGREMIGWQPEQLSQSN